MLSLLRSHGRKVLMTGCLLLILPLALMGATRWQTNSAFVQLNHTPMGKVLIQWTNAHGGTLSVQMWLSGLAPNSTHPAHIHYGTCAATGGVHLMLNNVVANAAGVGSSTTILTGIPDAIPQGAINVHNGPTLAQSNTPWLNQYLPIACANTFQLGNRFDIAAHEWLTMRSPLTVDQQASGNARLQIVQGRLVVTLTAFHLQPFSQHVAHIHQGSCANQGGVLYGLTTLQADGNGYARSQTIIPGVSSIPTSGWYVNVHLAPTMAALGTQTGFDPIACGDVQ